MGNARRYLLVSCIDFKNVLPLAVQKLDHPERGVYWILPIIPKIQDYLQISQIPPCAIKNSNVDSEPGKRFFRKLREFLAPGLQVHKSRILWDGTEFLKNVVILTIFQESTIFQSLPKCVDEGWHRRHQKFETFNHSIFTPQKIM